MKVQKPGSQLTCVDSLKTCSLLSQETILSFSSTSGSFAFVPTPESIRQATLLDKFSASDKPAAMMGPTGDTAALHVSLPPGKTLVHDSLALQQRLVSGAASGKTITAWNWLQRKVGTTHSRLYCGLSYQTRAGHLHQYLFENLVSRPGRLLGPSDGKKLTVFFDDLFLPEVCLEWFCFAHKTKTSYHRTVCTHAPSNLDEFISPICRATSIKPGRRWSLFGC